MHLLFEPIENVGMALFRRTSLIHDTA